MKHIYLDNAATTKIDPRVLDAMMPYLTESYGNPSSVHAIGRESKVMIEDARDVIADFIGARSSEIYFTSGGTEANNFAVKGLAFAHLGKKDHIITSPIEHSSVKDSLEYLQQRFGFNITYTPLNNYGIVDLDFINNNVSGKTLMVCVMYANNELGVINDITSIADIANEKGIFVHTDAVQSLGKVKFNVKEIGCTTASFSSHKIYGPKGIGALYIKKDTPIDKLIHGGKQERDRRGGTENIAYIAGFKKAVELMKENMENDIAHYKKLKDRLTSKLKNELGDKITFNSSEDTNGLNNIINISLNPAKVKIDSDALIVKMDMNGIAVSSGSACTSGSVQPSHVLKAIGKDDETAKSSMRISFGRNNKEEDCDRFIEILKEILK
jgi:cysteine desulfurase